MYFSALDERKYHLYFSIGVLIVVMAFILSIIALQSYEILERRTIKVDLMRGLHQPVLSIFNYSSHEVIENITLYFQSYCINPVNVTLIQIAKVGGTRSHSFIIEPYSSRIVKLDDITSLISIKPMNGTIVITLEAVIERRPYLILSIFSFLLFIIGFALTVIHIMYRVLRKQIIRYS